MNKGTVDQWHCRTMARLNYGMVEQLSNGKVEQSSNGIVALVVVNCSTMGWLNNRTVGTFIH